MSTKYKDVRPKKGVNKPFEKCFHAGMYSKNFLERKHPISTYISAQFSAELF